MVNFKDGFTLNDVITFEFPIEKYNDHKLILNLISTDEEHEKHHELISKDDQSYVYTLYIGGYMGCMSEWKYRFQYKTKLDRNRSLLENNKENPITSFYQLYYGIYLEDIKTMIGHCCVTKFGENGIEFSLYIHKEFKGHSYATSTVKGLIKVMQKYLDINVIVYECLKDNEPSNSVAKKNNFKFVEDLIDGWIRYKLYL